MELKDIKKVTLIGGGVLGSQIAYISAYWGYDVSIYMRSEGSIGRTKPKMERLHKVFVGELEACKPHAGTAWAGAPRGLVENIEALSVEDIDGLIARANAAFESVTYERDLQKAVSEADLIIEAMAENPQQKIDMYNQMLPFEREDTIICTNSSTLLPSSFAQYMKVPANYLALHFANNIWRQNTGEVMGHAGTSPEAYKTVVEFTKSIHMIPLELHKEQPGYILNSLLVPFLHAATVLWAREVADPATIDLTWQLATGAPHGPFRIMDVVGLTTVYNIEMMAPGATDPESEQYKICAKMKEKIDKGETGINAGIGFYDYRK